MDFVSPATRSLADAVRSGVLDAELASLVGLLAERDVSLIVAADDPARAGELLSALDPARQPVDLDRLGDGARALVRAASLGAGFAATTRAESLEEVFDCLRAAAGLSDDELTYLGVVVVLDRDGCVSAAHYVRPLALDGHGHVQRLGPAVLAARDATTGRLEHFAWGVLPELAARTHAKSGDLEMEIGARRDRLAHEAGHPA